MDRVINIKVGGNYISKDNKNAGVTGEGNVTNLRITFDEGWEHYAKTVTFWDARGQNPVKRVQGVDLIEDITKDTLIYITPIPKEPLAIAGEMTFVIDGYLDGKRQRSISDKLVVKESPMADNAEEPTDPTPEPYEQLQSEIEKIKQDIQDTAKAKEEMENMSVSCETLSPGEDAFVEKIGEEGINLRFGLPAGDKGEKGDKGDTGERGPQGDKGEQGVPGEQGPQGIQGYTPSVVLRYDEKTGNLYYDSDGILADKEYIETQNIATKDYVNSGIKKVETEMDKKVDAVEGMGLSKNNLTDEMKTILENMLNGFLALDNGNGTKTYIYFDGLLASGYPFSLDLGGGSIDNCTYVGAEIIRYLDMNTGYWVDVSEAIKVLNSRVDGFDTPIRNASGSRETLSFLDIHNSETRCLEILDELTIDIPDGEYPEQFIAGLVFSSGETATTVIYSADSRIIQWVGTDCSTDGNYSVFIPLNNKNYDIVFYFNGTHFVGLVNGYETVTSNTEV